MPTTPLAWQRMFLCSPCLVRTVLCYAVFPRCALSTVADHVLHIASVEGNAWKYKNILLSWTVVFWKAVKYYGRRPVDSLLHVSRNKIFEYEGLFFCFVWRARRLGIFFPLGEDMICMYYGRRPRASHRIAASYNGRLGDHARFVIYSA